MRRNVAIVVVSWMFPFAWVTQATPLDEQVKKLRTAGKFKAAIYIIENKPNPSAGDRWFLGKLYLDTQRPSLAIKQLEAVCPQLQRWNCHNDWGTALLMMGRYKAARNVFKEAYYKVNANARLASNLAIAWALIGNSQKAEMLHKEAVSGAQGKQDGIALINYAAFLVDRERYKEAKPYLESAGNYASVRDHFFRWLTLGKWHARQGQYSAALQCYNKGLAEHPTYFELYYERAQVFKVFSNAPMALADLRMADSVWPGNEKTEPLRAEIRKMVSLGSANSAKQSIAPLGEGK